MTKIFGSSIVAKKARRNGVITRGRETHLKLIGYFGPPLGF